MMNTKLPPEFTPYIELIICSNRFINGQVPIEIKKSNILLVGRGDHPQVWISTYTSPKSSLLIHLVEKNRSIRKEIDVLLPNNESIVSYKSNIILHVKKLSEEIAEIVELDFRPIGLSIHGDENGLFVGTNILSKNTFENTHTMIAIE